MVPFNKIFCIGLNKTGTTSLHKAFEIIGLKSVHCNGAKGNIKKIISTNFKNNIKLLSGIEEYDVYLDWNMPHTNFLFRKFDLEYPGSKFIFSTRDIESWLLSREKHVKKKPDFEELKNKYPNSTWFNIDKTAWKIEWLDHYKEVTSYFINRREDLLVIDIPGGDGWEKLCSFLDIPIPSQPFPVLNISKHVT